MADEIRQQLTFDASNAISALDSLSTALKNTRQALIDFGKSVSGINRTAGSAVQSLNNLATAAANLRSSTQGGIVPSSAISGIQRGTGLVDQFGNSLSSSATAAQQASSAGQKAVKTTQQVGQSAGSATNNVQRLTITFGTLARIITTQLTVRAFASFIQGVRTATEDAIEFQKRLAEIGSIATNEFKDLDTAAETVRRISDAFNQPLGEVQEGLYQVISNQIQGAAEQIQVLESASNLAKVGVADLSDTVNLLTGTINAFQLDAGNANQIAGVFFETVRLGRTRIGELAQSFGSVAPLAKEAGLEFEELAGAFATITVNGVDTAKAATQLRGVINAFIKPTKEMAAVLREAGFSSGELAIETLGLGGALDLIQKATGGSTTEMAKLIPRVRGLAGALVLARNEGQKLEDNINELRATTDDLLRAKLDLRLETNAEQVESALNRVKNALTIDLGQAILESINTFGAANKAADVLVGTIKIFGPVLVTLGTAAGVAALALGAYTLAAKTASVANTALASTSAAASRGLQTVGLSASAASKLLSFVGPATIAALGFTIGFQLGNSIFDALEEAGDRRGEEAARKLGQKLLESDAARQLETDRKVAEERIRNIKNVTKEIQKFLAETKQTEQQREDVFIQTNDAILKDTERLFDGILDANKQLIKDLENERDAANDNLKDSLENSRDIRQNIEDSSFKNSLNFLNDRQKLFKLEARGAEIAANANRELSQARTAEQREVALGQLERAEGFFKEAESIAQSTGVLQDQVKVFRSRQSAASGTLRAEQAFQATQRQIKADAEATLKIEKERVRELNKQVEEAQAAIDAFQSAKGPAEQLEALKRARAEIADITPELAFGTTQFDFGQLASFTQFRKNLEDQIADSNIDSQLADLLGGTKLTELNNEFARASTEGTLKGIREAEKLANEAGIELNARLDLEFVGSEQLQNVIDQLLQQSQSAQTNIQTGVNRAVDQQARDVAGQQAIERASVDTNFLRGATEAVTNFLVPLEGGVTKFRNELSGIAQDSIAVANNLENISFGEGFAQVNSLRERLQELEANARTLDLTATSQLRSQISTLIEELSKANEVGLPKAQQDASQINTDLQTAANEGSNYASQLSQALPIAREIAGTLGSANATTARFGGLFANGGIVKYLAGGGFSPQGTDTIPAMLSPGEFVVNARSARKFYPQLQAINAAGVRPVYRQDGGAVTNNIGDINVTVSGGRDGDQTGRTIARRIRRELRRGTSSL